VRAESVDARNDEVWRDLIGGHVDSRGRSATGLTCSFTTRPPLVARGSYDLHADNPLGGFYKQTNSSHATGVQSYVFNDLPNGVEHRWVGNYSSSISPGLFQGGLRDVTALSHEMSETFADPFVVSDGIHGPIPWWLSPNGNCQDNMEVGDVIENLPDGLYPVTLKGFTCHPQNEALMQWFDTGQASNALDGAFSYRDTSVLTSPATVQNVNCTP
jgi:hypothetical protein